MSICPICVFPMDVKGWLSSEEGKTLYQLGLQIPKEQLIVEIGSHQGRSTICLAQAARDGEGPIVVAIDHFRDFNPSDPRSPIPYYESYAKNLRDWDLDKYVRTLAMPSHDAAEFISKPIGLLFVDGDHRYEGVKDDCLLYLPKMAVGGCVMFHDTIQEPGVAKAVAELEDPKYKLVKQVGVSRVYQVLR